MLQKGDGMMFLILMITTTLFANPAQTSFENAWNHTVIDAAGTVDVVSLSLDQWDLPHIAYEKNGEIWYAHREAGEWTWSIEQVGNGEEPSVALMPGGDPVVLYLSGSTQLTLASKEDDAWTYETYNDFDRALSEPVLAISPDGTKYMVYFNWMYGYRHELRYAFDDGTGWTRTELESSYGENVISTSPSLALTPGGFPIVSAIKIYIDDLDDSYNLKLYAMQSATSWTTSTIASSFCRGQPAIAAISDSVTAVCYSWNNPDGLRYVEYPGSAATVIYDSEVYFPHIDTDSQGDPHLIFLNGDILVYLYDGVTQQFPEYGSTWYALDIQLDNYDQPHITFNGDDNLNYLWFGDPSGIATNEPLSGSLINSISPSPATTQTQLTLNPSLSGSAELTIYDLTGRTLIQTQTTEITTTLNLTTLTPGIYFVRAEAGNSTDSRLLTIIR